MFDVMPDVGRSPFFIMRGWISLHRSITEHWLYPKGREFTKYEAWIDILLEVNHADKKVLIKDDLFYCKRGESVRSLKEWGKRWGWSRNKVRRFLEMLEKDSMIVLKPEQKTTHLTVCNYDTYQDTRNGDGPSADIKRTADGPQTDTNNNDNNVNNHNNGNNVPTLEMVEKYFKDRGIILKRDAKAEAKKFIDYYGAMDWQNNGYRLNWATQARRWENTHKKFKQERQRKHEKPF